MAAREETISTSLGKRLHNTGDTTKKALPTSYAHTIGGTQGRVSSFDHKEQAVFLNGQAQCDTEAKPKVSLLCHPNRGSM